MSKQQLVVICERSDTHPPVLWCWKCDSAVEMPQPDWFDGMPRGTEMEMIPICAECARDIAAAHPDAFTKGGFG